MAKIKQQEKENIIELKGVKKSYDGAVVANVNFGIKKGEFVTLLGPSGCGKTTTLRMIAGFETPSEGQILINGEDFTSVPPHKRPVNTVFQRYALFPHLNVYKNVAFGLKLKLVPDGTYYTDKNGVKYENLRKLTPKEIDEKVNYALKMVDLEDYGHRNVNSLSGGQQQRVAIARALALSPDVLCFDEPTSALDPELTGEVLKVIKGLKSKDRTMIIVTHEMDFAKNVSDKVIFMSDGEITEMGSAVEVFNNPQNPKTISFLNKSKESI